MGVMKGIQAFLAAICAAVFAFAAMPATADAQCRLCDTPTYLPDDAGKSDGGDIALSVDTSLDFDQLIVLGVGSGSAVINADGSQHVEGAVTAMSSRAMVGEVTVRGQPDRRLDVMLPPRIELYSTDGSRITLEAIEADLPAAPRLDENGLLRFRFGGRLRIDGGLEGDFRGNITIAVDYL